jgi:hypothetical protein
MSRLKYLIGSFLINTLIISQLLLNINPGNQN